MNLYRPFAAEVLALIFNQVSRHPAATGSEAPLRLRPLGVVPSRCASGRGRGPKYNPISRLKCRRETPILSRWITASGGRKQPEGINGRAPLQRPVPRQGCRV